jgi:phosphoribosylanthranilate isomerase
VKQAPGIPRTLTPQAASSVLGETPAQRVGVFVNASEAELLQAARLARLDVLQLHGDEPPQLAAALREQGFTVWKALRPRPGESLGASAAPYAGAVDGVLLDGWSPAARGGTGTAFDWEEVAAQLEAIPAGVLLVAAGGLNPGNVARAASLLRPDVVDVSSGVERAPGEKDAAALREFCRAVREMADDAAANGIRA